MSTDKYQNFKALECAENPNDYEPVAVDREQARVVVIAPHGGMIEPGTSELAQRIAGDDLSRYEFRGRKEANNRDLHITSHHFDEPKGIALVARHEYVIAVHGCRGSETIFLGGLDSSLVAAASSALKKRGLSVATEGHAFMGRDPKNICNRGSRGAGLQVELPPAFREVETATIVAEALREIALALNVKQR